MGVQGKDDGGDDGDGDGDGDREFAFFEVCVVVLLCSCTICRQILPKRIYELLSTHMQLKWICMLAALSLVSRTVSSQPCCPMTYHIFVTCHPAQNQSIQSSTSSCTQARHLY